MKKIVLLYGFISGTVLAALAASMVPLLRSDQPDFSTGELIGYSSMVLAFLLVFFGVRTYRENEGGGSITFGRAFRVAILITLVACVMYVAAWQVIRYSFVPDFSDKYTQYVLDDMVAKGASKVEVDAERKRMDEFNALYENTLVNIGITFLEVFPVGVVMSLIAAAILRKKPQPLLGTVAARAVSI